MVAVSMVKLEVFELETLISCKIRTDEDCWAEELPHSW
jgi:hypothetical protein